MYKHFGLEKALSIIIKMLNPFVINCLKKYFYFRSFILYILNKEQFISYNYLYIHNIINFNIMR